MQSMIVTGSHNDLCGPNPLENNENNMMGQIEDCEKQEAEKLGEDE